MPLHRPKDLLAGLIFVVIGLAMFFMSQNYEIGAANRMGPGYLPAGLSLVLLLIGLVQFIAGFRNPEADPIEHHAIEPLAFILASVAAFGFLIDRAGMIIAVIAMVYIACGRRVLRNPVEVTLIAVLLTTFCYLLFIYMLGLNIPLFW